MNQPANCQFFHTTAEALSAMRQAIGNAQSSIYWETYIFEDDELGRSFVDLLLAKARAGVEIKLILDGFGSWWSTSASVNALRQSGVEVLYHNPLNLSTLWRGIWRLLERNHRKILIVDRQIGFIGSVNLYKLSFHWFDLHARVTGPIVNQLLKNFGRSYLAGGGLTKRIKGLLNLPIVKEKYWRILWHKPRPDLSSVRQVYLEAIKRAKKRLTIVAPYFLPDRGFVKALGEAQHRGVKIELILPWRTDHFIITHASRAYWRLFHDLGLKMYLVKKMIHAKAVMVDGHWAMMGSSNVDNQTFYRNYESNLIFTNQQMIVDLKKIFLTWKKRSRLFRSREWEKRGHHNKILESFFRWLRPIL